MNATVSNIGERSASLASVQIMGHVSHSPAVIYQANVHGLNLLAVWSFERTYARGFEAVDELQCHYYGRAALHSLRLLSPAEIRRSDDVEDELQYTALMAKLEEATAALKAAADRPAEPTLEMIAAGVNALAGHAGDAATDECVTIIWREMMAAWCVNPAPASRPARHDLGIVLDVFKRRLKVLMATEGFRLEADGEVYLSAFMSALEPIPANNAPETAAEEFAQRAAPVPDGDT